MYAFVRFTAAAALIAFGSIIAVGAMLLVPPVVEKIRVARTERSAPPATQCEQDCPTETAAALDLPALAPGDAPNATPSFALSTASSAAPSIAPSATPITAPTAAPSAAPGIEPRLAGHGAATTVDEPSSTGHASGQRAAEPPPAALIFEKPASQSELPVLERTPTVSPPDTQPRRVAKPRIKPQPKAQARLAEPKEPTRVAEPREPAPRPARPARTAKRSNNDALRAVRRFGDDLQDIPVNSFSGDGRPRTIMIRPTSVQDVYYYSRER